MGSDLNFVAFGSQTQAFNAGVVLMNQNGSWGKYDGWAGSAVSATASFNLSFVESKDGLDNGYSLIQAGNLI